ncbi:MAG: glutamine--fructose-6-phosphate transaminase (isomerizing) [Bryobacterales bacterium]
MCGIVGYIGPSEATPIIIDGLRRLEYRGYDSAGVAVGRDGEPFAIRRAAGKLRMLEEAVRLSPVEGNHGIGHTRWATHGQPTEENAHPHRDQSGDIVVVHNGIIENYLEIKAQLRKEGHTFVSDTDSEVIAHLIDKYSRNNGVSLEDAMAEAIERIRGVYAMAAISRRDPDKLVAARSGPPVIIGLGDNEYFIASDTPAILHHTRDFIFLDDGDVAVLTPNGVSVRDAQGRSANRPVQHILWDPVMAEKGGYKHFMLKEIFEQPRAVRETALGRVNRQTGRVFLDEMGLTPQQLRSIRGVRIIACGTSWHAGLAGKFMIERLARIPVEVDYGSEFRYRDPILDEEILTVAISQSGETADTLAAQREAKAKGSPSIAICNVIGSMITREAAGSVYTHAGPEIGVASTKAFTSQLTALFVLALHLAQQRRAIHDELSSELANQLFLVPTQLEETLRLDERCEELAQKYYNATDALFLGRGIHYPIALEGALKLKEISLHPRRGLPGRRDEARAQRADRRASACRRHRGPRRR